VQSGGTTFNLTNVSANHTVTVFFTQATLSISTSSLALSVNDIATNAALTGTVRRITITNTGFVDAINVAANVSGLPSGTALSASSCSGTLIPGASCSVSITPGATSTSDCNSGIAPTPDTLTFTADNASSTQAEIVVLTYGCIYQGGLLYAVDDTTQDTGSIGGSVLALTDLGNMEWGGVGMVVNASSNTDGAMNTDTIVAALGNGNYAAQACSNFTIDTGGSSPCSSGTCYSDWYLPAICEWGYDAYATGSGCGASSSPLRQNIQSNLVDKFISGVSPAWYWSSTESTNSSSMMNAWTNFPLFPNQQSENDKSNNAMYARCARALVP
jgi:hypothetical protein